jgi:mRNA interferase MazF
MALSFVPRPGSVVVCDFAGYVRPEMIKKRRVVVLSPVRAFSKIGDVTVVVVPLSELEPRPILPWHHQIVGGRYAGVKPCWAKGDLVSHVGLVRLDRVFHSGTWTVPVVDRNDLVAIRAAVVHAIGIS